MKNSKCIPFLLFILTFSVSNHSLAQNLEVEGEATIGSPGNGNNLLTLFSERPWIFRQFNTGPSTALELYDPTGLKNFLINTTGYVGIGTTSPVSKLTILTPNNSTGFTHMSDQGIVLATSVGGISATIGTSSNHTFRLIANSQAVINITPVGNVGIGTTNPTYKLSVLGNIRCTEAVVETGWADFVFDDDYRLPSLNEVEKFIDYNNHLPNIPTASEIQKNGLRLGEIQTKMMAKIEELTLYLIEANKRIINLEKAIEER
jgi:hypothetical protein